MVGVGGALCSAAPVRHPFRHSAGRVEVPRSSRLACRCAAGPPPALPPAAVPAGGSVRLAGEADLDALCELEDLTADGASWNRRQIEAELSRERATVLVVDEGGGPVGWAVAWEVPFELHLMSVAVHPAHRRRGLARRLLTALFEQHRDTNAEAMLLEVRASNQAALQLYRSFGFKEVGLRRGYYQDGEDAVLMTLQLPAAQAAAAAPPKMPQGEARSETESR